MKLCFVSVNGPREPYLLDETRITNNTNYKKANKHTVTQTAGGTCISEISNTHSEMVKMWGFRTDKLTRSVISLLGFCEQWANM
jgi:hypothetical protein